MFGAKTTQHIIKRTPFVALLSKAKNQNWGGVYFLGTEGHAAAFCYD